MSMAYIGPDDNVLKTWLALANEMKHMKKYFLQTEALPNKQRANTIMCFILFRQIWSCFRVFIPKCRNEDG